VTRQERVHTALIAVSLVVVFVCLRYLRTVEWWVS
jgi:hypothetical protein